MESLRGKRRNTTPFGAGDNGAGMSTIDDPERAMKHEILIEWDRKSSDHIHRHNVYPKEVENAVKGRILLRNTSKEGSS